ncbi:hypothetical protein, partial [Mesotoga sp.]|uniref:hypothetical protein n=1 Tax=Mesotoga sp. TaxID=2053577 RepID=UPI002BBEB523
FRLAVRKESVILRNKTDFSSSPRRKNECVGYPNGLKKKQQIGHVLLPVRRFTLESVEEFRENTV